MRNYYRWAAVAGAAILAATNVSTAWAEEGAQAGATFETAVEVPAPGGQAGTGNGMQGTAGSGTQDTAGGGTQMPGEVISSGDGGQSAAGTVEGAVQAPAAGDGGQASVPDAGGNPASPQSTSSTRVIRTGGDGGAGDGAASAGTPAPEGGAGSGNIDYSRGPGFAGQEQEQEQDQGQTPAQPPQLDQSGQAGQDANVQIYDVVNPVVKVVDKYSYDQMVQDIAILQQNNSSRMQVSTIGTSLDGRAIYDCIIGNPAAAKHILIQGGIHGREYINPMLLMQQMEMILANYDTGSFHGHSLPEMFAQVAIHFVPMTNPDGVTISQFGPDQIRSQQLRDVVNTCYVTDTASGRTSADPASYFSRWKANGRGVDLNVNFDALWQDITSLAFPSYADYKGTAPGSEPESQALINLYQAQYPWAAVISYHSMGDVIYWDVAGNKSQQKSAELANLMSQVTGGYRILPSNGGGGYKDWIQLGNNPVPSVTIETGKVSCPIPVSEYSTIWSQNRLTWAYAMEWAAMQ